MSFDSDGYVNITWTNAGMDDTWYAYRVYRRETPETVWDLLAETNQNYPSYEFHDWLAKSMVEYEYAVVQVSNEYGDLIESAYVPQVVTPISSNYWLLDPYDETHNICLHSVTDDSFTDEYETEELHLIGDGRHVDVGEHWGVRGTLTCQLRDRPEITAREQRLLVSRMRDARDSAYLRTPFGDLWLVLLSDISFTRMSGVGQREFGDLSIPYAEIGTPVAVPVLVAPNAVDGGSTESVTYPSLIDGGTA